MSCTITSIVHNSVGKFITRQVSSGERIRNELGMSYV